MQAQAALVFAVATTVVILFQIALALGAPWGQLAMGGRFPGRFPPKMRVAAVFQGGVLLFLALIVLCSAGLVRPDLSDQVRPWTWGVVLFCIVGLVANLATPSKWERRLWAPTVSVMLLSSLWVVWGHAAL